LKFSESTISILKNFASTQNSIRIVPGNVISIGTDNKATQARATVSETFTTEFGIYDLSKFLSILSLFKEPEIEFKDKQLVIASGAQKVNYSYAAPNLIYRPEKEPKLNSDVTFNVTHDILNGVIKALNVLQLPELAIVGEEGKISLQAVKSKERSADNYSVIVGETDRNFRAIINAGYLKMIARDYEIIQDIRGMTMFNGNDVVYWIANDSCTTN
jgi:hypothetical protein